MQEHELVYHRQITLVYTFYAKTLIYINYIRYRWLHSMKTLIVLHGLGWTALSLMINQKAVAHYTVPKFDINLHGLQYLSFYA